MVKSCGAIVALLCLFELGCSTDTTRESVSSNTLQRRPQSTTSPVQSESKYVLTGDSVALSVWGYPEFATRTTVKETGTITIPLVGEVLAAGYTREEFTAYIKQRLAEFIKGDIKLLVEVSPPLPRITVLGAVSRQGSFQTRTEMPLLEVLSNVGGWTEQSDLRYVRISRQTTLPNEATTVEVDLESFMDTGNIKSIPVVRPGDVVFVQQKENVVREVSEFLRDALLLFGFFSIFD